jgi:hypothetical protein
MAVYSQLPTPSYVMSVLPPFLHTFSFPYTSRFHYQISTTQLLSHTAIFAACSDTAPLELSCSLVSVRNQPTSLFCTIQFARDDHTIRARGRALGESSRLLNENGVDLQAVGFLLTGGRNADYIGHIAVVLRVALLYMVSRWTLLRCGSPRTSVATCHYGIGCEMGDCVIITLRKCQFCCVSSLVSCNHTLCSGQRS